MQIVPANDEVKKTVRTRRRFPRLRTDMPLSQRVYMRLLKPRHTRRITENVAEFSNDDRDYAEYVSQQIWKTRVKQFTNSRSRLDVYVDLVLEHCVDLPENPKILSIGSRNHYELVSMADRGLSNVTGSIYGRPTRAS